ncbi:hypothetical protein CsSME_00013867 [Camellia sinensis var. sinensis]
MVAQILSFSSACLPISLASRDQLFSHSDFEPCIAMANDVIATRGGQQCIFRTRTILDMHHPHGPFTETRILLNPLFMAPFHPKLVVFFST